MVTLFYGFGYMVVLLFVLICLWLRKKVLLVFLLYSGLKTTLYPYVKCMAFRRMNWPKRLV